MNDALSSLMQTPAPVPAHRPALPSTRRYLALWLPYLSTDRLRRRSAVPDDCPFVLVEKERGALRLAAIDATAREAGLRQGMTLAEARALVPALATGDLDVGKDMDVLFRCAEAAMRFTPLVALDGADGLLLDITGCAHLFGGEVGLLKDIVRLMRRSGLTSRAAIAATPEGARAFARFGEGDIVPASRQEALAHGLSVAALEAEPETATALARAGFRTLGDLAGRPSSALVARFGAGLLARLDGILGRSDRRISPLRAPPDIVAERHFAEPVMLVDSIMEVLERLAGEVSRTLEQRGEGGRQFDAEFYRVDGAVRRLGIETGEPTRTPDVLIRLLRLKIETLADPLDPGFGFDAVRIAVCRSEPLAVLQNRLVEADEARDGARAVAGLVDRLVARFGRENVQRLVARDTHDPVRAAAAIAHRSADVSASLPPPEEGEPPARPLTLFDRPLPIDVTAEVPDGPPLRFRWRRVLHEVTRAEGPERIAPEWWRWEDTLAEIRDYYRVEDAEGYRFWLFREGFYAPGTQVRWYVHGLFA